ncbi:MAG: DUF362 domain-containing protein [Candidatus Woesearchaeota archaeon]
MHNAAISRCKRYSYAYRSIKKAVDLLGGMGNFVKPRQRVLLKINQLNASDPKRAVTTHPQIVAAVIRLVKEAGGIPVVGDSPITSTLSHVMKKTGIKEVLEKTDTEFVEFDKPKEYQLNGKILKDFQLTSQLDEFDVIINLPKLKTHAFTTYSGAVKNLYGLVPGKLKAYQHVKIQQPCDFWDMLLDIYDFVKPRLTIMDGVIGMEGQGPNWGKPRHAGIIIAGTDSLAVDRIACSIIHLEPDLFKQAIARGMSQANSDNLIVYGTKGLSIPFENPNLWQNSKLICALQRFGTMFTSKPVINKDCTGCGECQKVCPKNAIALDKVARINYNLCIRCMCCNEACPHDAIKISRNRLLGLLK